MEAGDVAEFVFNSRFLVLSYDVADAISAPYGAAEDVTELDVLGDVADTGPFGTTAEDVTLSSFKDVADTGPVGTTAEDVTLLADDLDGIIIVGGAAEAVGDSEVFADLTYFRLEIFFPFTTSGIGDSD